MASSHDSEGRLHPKAKEAFELMERGRLSRREFIRIAALVGVSAGAAYAMAGLPNPAFAASDLPFVDDPNAKKGGTLRVAMEIQKMEDPANYDWTQMSNVSRQIVEYVAFTDPDECHASDAGGELGRLRRPQDLDAASPQGRQVVERRRLQCRRRDLQFQALDGSGGRLVECRPLLFRRDDGGGRYRRKERRRHAEEDEAHDRRRGRARRRLYRPLHLQKSVLSVPEDLYNYPTAILHRDFKAPFSDNPVGTGPFQLTQFAVADKAFLKRRDGPYWGGDVYLDEIHYLHYDAENQLTAFASGEADAIYQFGIEQMPLAQSIDGQIIAARTAQTLCCRMQVDKAPFDDKRVRQAITKAVDNATIKGLIFPDGGDVAENHHVAPIHPEYFSCRRSCATSKRRRSCSRTPARRT